MTDYSFDQLGLNKHICSALQTEFGIQNTSHVQYEVIRNFYENDEDIIAIAETGSGKTLSYLAPVLNEIIEKDASALVVTSSGLLVKQIVAVAAKIMRKIESDLDLENENRIGFGGQVHSSSLGVAPIGRNGIISNMNKQRQYLILDEADMLFSSEHFNQTMNLINSMSDDCRIICLQERGRPAPIMIAVEIFVQGRVVITPEKCLPITPRKWLPITP